MISGVVDQALSSTTNLAPQFTATVLLTRAGFATVSIAFLITLLSVEIVRAVTGEVLLTLPPDPDNRRLANMMFGTTLMLSLSSAVLVATGAMLASGGELRTALLAGAAVAPIVSLQDVFRFINFSRSEPHFAAMNDLIWCLSLAAIYVLYLRHMVATPAGLVALWGLASLPSVVIVVAVNRVRPSVRWPGHWLRASDWRGARYCAEYLADRWSSAIGVLVAGAVGGSAVIATVRGAQLIAGPVITAVAGLSLVLGPRAVGRVSAPRREFDRWIVGRAIAVGLVGGVAVLSATFVPTSIGQAVLGDVWKQGVAVRVPLTLYVVTGSIVVFLRIGARVKGGERRSLRMRTIVAPTLLLSPVIGAAIAGESGSMWGVAIATSLMLAAWIHVYARTSREYGLVVGADLSP